MKTTKKELTDMQQRFLDALFDDDCQGDFRKAMKTAGYAKDYPVNSVVTALKDEIIDRAEHYLALNAPKATMYLLGVLNKPEGIGARNLVAAAREVLDRVGIVKKEQVSVSLTDNTGIFILPPKKED